MSGQSADNAKKAVEKNVRKCLFVIVQDDEVGFKTGRWTRI
jgi:hypothetical protein